MPVADFATPHTRRRSITFSQRSIAVIAMKRETMIADLDDANRCVRDVVTLSALPTAWIGRDVHFVASGMCDVLYDMLHPILVYTGIRIGAAAMTIEAVRTSEGGLADSAAQEIGRGFSPWLNPNITGTAFSMPNPLGPGMARMTFVPIGQDGSRGFIVAVSHLVHFPNHIERLLLTVGANQVAIAIQNAQLLIAQRASAHYEGTLTRLRTCLRDICSDPHATQAAALTVDHLSRSLYRQPHGERLVSLLGELHDFAPYARLRD